MGARDDIARLATGAQRTEYRATAARAAVLAEKPKSGPMAMERNGLTLIFDADPELILNKRGEVIGVDAMVRAFRAGSEVKVDPHRICLNPPMLVPDGTYTEVTIEHAGREVTTLVPGMREDPRQAYVDWLFDNVEQFPNPEGWRTKGTVTTLYSGTADGGLYAHGGTWANAYNGTGTIDSPSTGSVSDWIGSIYTGSEFYTQTVFLGFDTSSIPDTDTVSAATFSLYARNGNSSRTFRMRAWTYDWGGSLTTGDFRTAAQLQALTELCDWPPTNAVSTGAYTDFENTANNLRDAISKTGTTYIIVSDNLHEAGTTNPLTADDCEWWLADQTGTTQDPKLVVTHAAGGATVTSDVTSTAAISTTNTSDVTSTAATSRTETKDVSSTGAISCTVASDVTTSAALSCPVASDVSTTAAIQANPSLDVTSTASITCVVASDVSTSASISQTVTSSVTTTAAISCVVASDVSTSAAIQCQVTKDVTTDASIQSAAGSGQADVTSTAATSRIETTNVSSDAAISMAAVSNVSSTAAISVDATASVTSTAAVSASATANVSSTAALNAPAAASVLTSASISIEGATPLGFKLQRGAGRLR